MKPRRHPPMPAADYLIVGLIVWLVGTLLLLVFHQDLIWVLIGAVVVPASAIVLLIGAIRRVRRSPIASIVFVLIISSMLVFVPTSGLSWGERTRFDLMRPSYERRLQQIISAHEHGARGNANRPDYIIDRGPPVRVAFMWQSGVIDNWVGLVYDPTGVVMRANGSDGDIGLGPVRKLFGGDIVASRHLQDHWYLCSFT